MQDCSISSVLAMEIHQSCTKRWMWCPYQLFNQSQRDLQMNAMLSLITMLVTSHHDTTQLCCHLSYKSMIPSPRKQTDKIQFDYCNQMFNHKDAKTRDSFQWQFFQWQIKLKWNKICCNFISRKDCYKDLQLPQQHSCHCICKILLW